MGGSRNATRKSVIAAEGEQAWGHASEARQKQLQKEQQEKQPIREEDEIDEGCPKQEEVVHARPDRRS